MGKKYLNRISSVLHLAICFYLFSAIACKQNAPVENAIENSEETDTLSRDFVEFYRTFHNDSTYQLSHIAFPLSGIMQDTAGRDSAVVWNADTWKLHKEVVPDEFWSVDFTIPLENVVIEFIHAKDGSFWMERRFAKIDSHWNLIYYGGLKSSWNNTAPHGLVDDDDEG